MGGLEDLFKSRKACMGSMEGVRRCRASKCLLGISQSRSSLDSGSNSALDGEILVSDFLRSYGKLGRDGPYRISGRFLLITRNGRKLVIWGRREIHGRY